MGLGRGQGRRLWAEKEDDWLLSRVICLKNNRGRWYLICNEQSRNALMQKKDFSIKTWNDPMQSFFKFCPVDYHEIKKSGTMRQSWQL